MLDTTTIGEVIRLWIESTTSLACIYADGAGPRPTDPYLTLKLIVGDSLGEGEVEGVPLVDYSIDLTHSNIFDLQVSVNAFRGTAFQQISKLIDALNHVSTYDIFTAASIGIGRTTEIRDIPDVVNKKSEARAQVDLFFHVRSTSTENIEGIKQVEITNEIDGYTTIVKHPDIP